MKKILIVEDYPAHIMLIKNALMEYNNLDLVTAKTGKEALEILKSDEPDLVILDLKMPVMNGFEFLTEKKKLPKPLRFTPVIVLTTSPLKKDIWASYELGAAAYVIKPLDYKELKDVAGYLLGFFERTELPGDDR